MKTIPGSETAEEEYSIFIEKAGKTDQDLTWSKFNELKAENEHLQQENSKLQSIIQDVTAVNKRWQKYNNERRLYVQKLLSTIQDLQEQINLISEKSAFRNNPQDDVANRLEDIEKLKKEHQEHITVLKLQIKSHKDDWDAERKEKRKAVQEKEELEDKVKDLTRDINFLKNVLQEERNRKPTTCSMCKNKIEESSIFSKTEFLPAAASLRVSKTFLPKTFRTSVHVPYSSSELSSDQCFFSEDDLPKERGESSQESSYYSSEFSQIDESFRNEHFSRSTKFTQGKKTLSGETIVVEDESGIRLSITEQYPQKDNMQLRSILKKNDKKLKLSSKSFSGQSDLKTDRALMFSPIVKPASMDEPNITCEEFESPQKECGLFIGFKDDGLARVTSFSPDSIPASDGSFQYLHSSSSENLQTNSKSKSEPNTRNTSPANSNPARESSSWNNNNTGDDTDTTENVVCPGCDRVFPPSTHLQFLDHFEICPSENDPF